MDSTDNKMKIEIWSDIACPFCYIGKRRLEHALAKLPEKDRVDIEWKSFQLNPDLQTDTSTTIFKYLADVKGISEFQAKGMNEQVSQMAEAEGLDFNFDKTVVANTFQGHQLIHFAKQYDKQNEAKEALLKAYFTDGLNIDDRDVLLAIAKKIELNIEELNKTLNEGSLISEVEKDIYESRTLGIRGVPFFVLNRKYGISGAQAPEVFEQSIGKAMEEWNLENSEKIETIAEGESCEPGQNC